MGTNLLALVTAAILIGQAKPPVDKKPGKPSPQIVRRVSTRDALTVSNEIDRLIDARLAEAKLTASPAADDAEFLRRATLDITGQIPTYAAARDFLEDTNPNKRRELIDNLLTNPQSGRRLASIWKRWIQTKPANNGKPQVDKFTPWLADQLNANRAWDEIVTELLTTEADLAREPQAYFLAVNSESFDPRPNLLTAATAKLFLGVQLACAECHNHPFAEWKQTEFWNLAAFFSRVHKRSKADFTLADDTVDGEQIEIAIPEGSPASGKRVPAQFLGAAEPAAAKGTLRAELATWLTAEKNPYFARAMVNRLWSQYFGRGLVEPLDGFQTGYTPTHPQVLELLAGEFVASDYDIQHIVRSLCNTRAYGRTSKPLAENEKDSMLNSRMLVKTLSPEMLYDSLTLAINTNPKPPVVPKGQKVPLPEIFSIGPRDEFLNFFTGAAVDSRAEDYAHGIPQLLRLMNSAALNTGAPLASSLAKHESTAAEKIEILYLAALARKPVAEEREALVEFVGKEQESAQAYAGAIWILLNSSEFVLNH